MSFTDCDGREPVQESTHRLRRGLRGRIADISGDDDRTAVAIGKPTTEILRESRDQADRGGDTECRGVVLIDLIPQPCVADGVQPHEVVERIGPTIRHDDTGEADRKAGLAERLHRLGCA